MKWKVFFASAAGRHHLSRDLPCQDSGHHTVVDDAFVGVVCDGAGSASEGRLGAELFATTVTELVSESIKTGRLAMDAVPDRRERLLAVIGEARARIGEIALSRQLALGDFACTLVGCIGSRDGGCFFHVGDGFAICVTDAGESVLSRPENGEYADETFFITDESWSDHFRVTPISEVRRGCLIGLMSDGTSPFAVNRMRNGFYGPFIEPIVAFLRNATEHDGNQALRNVLEHEKTLDITSDDKALLLALAS